MHYQNPIYPAYFADPFLWSHGGEYFAIGTGEREASGQWDGRRERVFPLLRSRDMVHWQPAGAALEPPDPALGRTFWAPEIAYAEGCFWLYYSVGHDDKRHQIRVASSQQPLGPYRDVREEPLVAPGERGDPPFAIDPHPFRYADGAWYLFYARDYLDSSQKIHPGTALAVDHLPQMDRVAGEEQTVLRARHPWQRFMANRRIYGNLYDWHTLEGPFVRRHEGRYFCFFSGGRWEEESYGVDYAVADHPTGPYSEETGAASPATETPTQPRVLRTVPGRVIGPGHNSIITAPDGGDYLAYHAWDPAMTARRLCIDPLLWTPHGPRCKGPS
jgi:beta-xylosidase